MFQIPEGTFGTLEVEVVEMVTKSFKSRKERLGQG